MDVIRVSACNEYRDRRADETQQQYTERLLNELEQAILEAGPERLSVSVRKPWWGRRRGHAADAGLSGGCAACAINTASCISPMR